MSTSGWSVPEDEVELRFVSSGGPGGQHANRSNTKVEAVFNVDESRTMPRSLRERVRGKIGNVIRVTVDDERSQYRNRQLALERIQQRIEEAAHVERPRRPTKPTRGSTRRRLDDKRKRADMKRQRKPPGLND